MNSFVPKDRDGNTTHVVGKLKTSQESVHFLALKLVKFLTSYWGWTTKENPDGYEFIQNDKQRW